MRIIYKLSAIGGFMVVAGLLSIVLYFLGYNIRLLMWIDLWGPAIGWSIRIGLVVLGALMFLFLSSNNEEQEQK